MPTDANSANARHTDSVQPGCLRTPTASDGTSQPSYESAALLTPVVGAIDQRLLELAEEQRQLLAARAALTAHPSPLSRTSVEGPTRSLVTPQLSDGTHPEPSASFPELLWKPLIAPLVHHSQSWVKHPVRVVMIAGALLAFMLHSPVVAAGVSTVFGTQSQACATALTSRGQRVEAALDVLSASHHAVTPADRKALIEWDFGSCDLGPPQPLAMAAGPTA